MDIKEMLANIEYEDVLTCPICAGSSIENMITDVQVDRPSQAWSLCLTCGHVFVNPRPTKKWLAGFYTDGYRAMTHGLEKGESSDRIPVKSVKEEQIRAMSVATGIMAVRAKVANHLDIGSSTGALCAGVIDMVKPTHSWGVEPNDAWRGFAEKAFGSRNKTLLDYQDDVHFVKTLDKVPKTTKFELVTVIHTLEHLIDPRGLLEQCHSRMRPGGLLVVEVPNRYGGLVNPLLWPHLHSFTHETLTYLLEDIGFRQIHVETHGNNPPLFIPSPSLRVTAEMKQPDISVDNVLGRYNQYRQAIGQIQKRMSDLRPQYDIG